VVLHRKLVGVTLATLPQLLFVNTRLGNDNPYFFSIFVSTFYPYIPFAMKKYLLLLPLALLMFSCGSDTETTDAETVATDTTAAPAPVEDPALKGLTDEDKKRYYDEYGIDYSKGMPAGLKVGDQAPIFKAKDHKGNELFLPDLYKDKPLVLVFYRGAWCPVCNKQLSAIEDSLKYIKNAGATLVAIAPETMDKVGETVEKTKASYSVIADPNGHIMNAYKLDFYVTTEYQKKINEFLNADIATYNGTKEARLPVPATYIIGTDGRIKYVYFHPDYNQRPTINEIIQELKKL
jgi:peroxiredoxin